MHALLLAALSTVHPAVEPPRTPGPTPRPAGGVAAAVGELIDAERHRAALRADAVRELAAAGHASPDERRRAERTRRRFATLADAVRHAGSADPGPIDPNDRRPLRAPRPTGGRHAALARWSDAADRLWSQTHARLTAAADAANPAERRVAAADAAVDAARVRLAAVLLRDGVDPAAASAVRAAELTAWSDAAGELRGRAGRLRALVPPGAASPAEVAAADRLAGETARYAALLGNADVSDDAATLWSLVFPAAPSDAAASRVRRDHLARLVPFGHATGLERLRADADLAAAEFAAGLSP